MFNNWIILGQVISISLSYILTNNHGANAQVNIIMDPVNFLRWLVYIRATLESEMLKWQ